MVIKDKIADTSAQNEFSLQGGFGSLRDVVEVTREELVLVQGLVWSPPPPLSLVLQGCPTGRRPLGRPKRSWRAVSSQLASEHLRILPEELK